MASLVIFLFFTSEWKLILHYKDSQYGQFSIGLICKNFKILVNFNWYLWCIQHVHLNKSNCQRNQSSRYFSLNKVFRPERKLSMSKSSYNFGIQFVNFWLVRLEKRYWFLVSLHQNCGTLTQNAYTDCRLRVQNLLLSVSWFFLLFYYLLILIGINKN